MGSLHPVAGIQGTLSEEDDSNLKGQAPKVLDLI